MEKKRFQKVYIEIINTCNLKCSFCKETTRNAKIMKPEEFKKVISKIKSYTNLIALHVKGEPLMHPNLNEILKICEENEMLVNITTNGTLIYENIDILSNSNSIRQINISLHSIEKNEGKFIKNSEEYLEDILKSIRILKEKNEPYISYRLWNLQKNSENDENIYILKSLEKEYQKINLIEEAKKHEFIELDDKIFLNQDIEFEWPDLNRVEKKEEGTCWGLRNQLAILSNGDIVPCCLDQNADIKLGNIFVNDIDEILLSRESMELINGFKKNKLIHELCKTCGFINKFNKN